MKRRPQDGPLHVIHVVAKRAGGWIVTVRYDYPTGPGVCIWQRTAATHAEVRKWLAVAAKVRRKEERS